jgi:hypothetical protein
VLTVSSMVARMARLNTLALGLSREVQLWQDTAHPLTYLELKVYLGALQDGIGRLEDARAALSKALDRIAREEAVIRERQQLKES